MGSGRSEVLQSIYGVFPQRDVQSRIALAAGRTGRGRRRYAISRGLALVAEDRKEQSLVLGNTIRFNISLGALPGLTRLGVVRRRRERMPRSPTTPKDLRVKAPSIETTCRTSRAATSRRSCWRSA